VYIGEQMDEENVLPMHKEIQFSLKKGKIICNSMGVSEEHYAM
jgi:hypothetical protein